jgi:hypothetical protein
VAVVEMVILVHLENKMVLQILAVAVEVLVPQALLVVQVLLS